MTDLKLRNEFGYSVVQVEKGNLNRSISSSAFDSINGFQFSNGISQVDIRSLFIIKDRVKSLIAFQTSHNILREVLSFLPNLELLSHDVENLDLRNMKSKNLSVYMGQVPKYWEKWSLKLEIVSVSGARNNEEFVNSEIFENSRLTYLDLSNLEEFDTTLLKSNRLERILISYVKSIKGVGLAISRTNLMDVDIYKAENLELSRGVNCSLNSLKSLKMSYVKEIDSFKCLSNAQNLEILTFIGSNIKDVDLLPLTKIPNLRHLEGRSNANFSPPLRTIKAGLRVIR